MTLLARREDPPRGGGGGTHQDYLPSVAAKLVFCSACT